MTSRPPEAGAPRSVGTPDAAADREPPRDGGQPDAPPDPAPPRNVGLPDAPPNPGPPRNADQPDAPPAPAPAPGFRRIVVSGASRGLGAALALRLAGPGVSLLLLGRDGPALDAVAAACIAAGATADTLAADLATQRDAIAARIEAFDDASPCDAVIANAGLAFGTAPDGTRETWREAAIQAEVNLIGAMAVAGPLLPRFTARRRGAVLLVASIAAFRGPVDTAGYAASKAGLRAWGEALRAALAPRGVRVTVACPGFFDSRMGDAWRGPRPLLRTTDRAADAILRGMRRGAARVDVPLAMALLLRLLDLLPPWLGDRALRLFRTRIARR